MQKISQNMIYFCSIAMIIGVYCRSALGHQQQNDSEVALLVDENEKMSNSLLSLTSHFAQVQFRLKQIIEGPEDCKTVRRN